MYLLLESAFHYRVAAVMWVPVQHALRSTLMLLVSSRHAP